MRLKSVYGYRLVLVTLLSSLSIAAQDVRVDVGKRATRIPKACESVVPASITDPIDMPGLIKEAVCKGAGDMMIEYTYVMEVSGREKDKKGNIKAETTTYEVFIPTLKSGMHTRGILLVTERNGVPVPPEELEKERLKTGERLEKEESKIAAADAPQPPANSEDAKGLLPLGMYTPTSVNRSAFGVRRGGATLSIAHFLRTCDLTLRRREQKDGREVLIFHFVPRPDVQYDLNQKYMAQLTGEIWIDVTDRIVTRLAGWPLDLKEAKPNESMTAAAEKPPAVYVEMMRVREGIWLPHVTRINGMDYPTLFDHITTDRNATYSNYIHFSTEVKDFKTEPPSKP